jgi:hypothetical protein
LEDWEDKGRKEEKHRRKLKDKSEKMGRNVQIG